MRVLTTVIEIMLHSFFPSLRVKPFFLHFISSIRFAGFCDTVSIVLLTTKKYWKSYLTEIRKYLNQHQNVLWYVIQMCCTGNISGTFPDQSQMGIETYHQWRIPDTLPPINSTSRDFDVINRTFCLYHTWLSGNHTKIQYNVTYMNKMSCYSWYFCTLDHS